MNQAKVFIEYMRLFFPNTQVRVEDASIIDESVVSVGDDSSAPMTLNATIVTCSMIEGHEITPVKLLFRGQCVQAYRLFRNIELREDADMDRLLVRSYRQEGH